MDEFFSIGEVLEARVTRVGSMGEYRVEIRITGDTYISEWKYIPEADTWMGGSCSASPAMTVMLDRAVTTYMLQKGRS